ncbi:MAG: Asp-tRNA(Asn)/Glu-tRNA(Gln) amidotransferase subunit GatC [Candidatus Hodarchaeota archaeon]
MDGSIKKISEREVEYIAWLAKIELEKEDIKLFTLQFNSILNYFDQINELDTTAVTPTHHVLDLVNAFRDDIIKPSLSINEALKNAPKKERRYFKAPKII